LLNREKTHCKRGHLLPSIRSKAGKRICKICKQIRDNKRRNPLGNISPATLNREKTHCKRGHELAGNNLKMYGNRRICLSCRNQRSRDRAKSPQVKQYRKKWQQNNKEKISNYSKKWRKNNPTYSTDYDKAHPEQYKQRQKKHESKLERKQYHRDWQNRKYANDPKFRELVLSRAEQYRLKFPRSSGETPQEFEAKNLRRSLDENKCQYIIDENTGKICGLRHSEKMWIQVHHIKPKAEYPELMADIDNLRTLCIYHHGLDHFNNGHIREAKLIWKSFISKTARKLKKGQTSLFDKKSIPP